MKMSNLESKRKISFRCGTKVRWETRRSHTPNRYPRSHKISVFKAPPISTIGVSKISKETPHFIAHHRKTHSLEIVQKAFNPEIKYRPKQIDITVESSQFVSRSKKSKLPLIFSIGILSSLISSSMLILPYPFNIISSLAMGGPLAVSMLAYHR